MLLLLKTVTRMLRSFNETEKPSWTTRNSLHVFSNSKLDFSESRLPQMIFLNFQFRRKTTYGGITLPFDQNNGDSNFSFQLQPTIARGGRRWEKLISISTFWSVDTWVKASQLWHEGLKKCITTSSAIGLWPVVVVLVLVMFVARLLSFGVTEEDGVTLQ